MDVEKVLKWMEQINEEESKVILEAAARRREAFLNGGEVLYSVYTKEEIAHIENLMRRLRDYREEEGNAE